MIAEVLDVKTFHISCTTSVVNVRVKLKRFFAFLYQKCVNVDIVVQYKLQTRVCIFQSF